MATSPGLVDANVLIYAMDSGAPQHAKSRTLLNAARDGFTTLYVTSQILCEVYSILTNPRRVSKPRSATEAINALTSLLTILTILPAPVLAVNHLINLLNRNPVTGGDVFDLQIVAAMKANGISRIYTYNTADFIAFPELEILTP